MENQNQVEQWRAIEGFPDYDVSSCGRVRSRKNEEERILRPGTDPCGYYRVSLSNDGKQSTCKVARLVAQAFLPNPDGLSQVDHVNHILTDNRVENLRWVNPIQNQLNSKKPSNNKSGIKGISRVNRNSWRVQLRVKGIKYNKTFKDMLEAREYLRGLVDALDIAEFYFNPDL